MIDDDRHGSDPGRAGAAFVLPTRERQVLIAVVTRPVRNLAVPLDGDV
jgi:hypothetical protein